MDQQRFFNTGTLFADLAHVLVYLDDIIIIGTGSYAEHLQQVEEVLARLLEKEFQVNPLKSFWAKLEVEYLRFVITREGICPQQKKSQGILSVKEPTSTKQLRSFYWYDWFLQSNVEEHSWYP